MTCTSSSSVFGEMGNGMNQTPAIRKSMNHLKEFSEETLKSNFDDLSKEYNDQFISAGFPPKICSQLVE